MAGVNEYARFRWERTNTEEESSAVSITTSRIAVGTALLAVVAACGGGSGTATVQPGSNPPSGAASQPAATGAAASGTIKISGSSTVQPITTAVQELFNQANPGVAITVDGPGTGDGFKLFCKGEIDIADASRAIKPTGEADVCATNGVKYIELKVALDGLSVITSAKNTASPQCLTFADLYALTGPESGPQNKAGDSQEPFTNWKQAQALATELGSKTVFPDAPLTITAPGEESGTYDFYIQTVITPIAVTRGLPADRQGARPDYQASANDNTIIEGVAGTAQNSTTLGWVGFAYVEENLDKVKPLEVDGGKGCVAPSHDTIANATYPISRDLFIYVNTDKVKTNPALAAYVDLYLKAGTIDTILQTVPYVGLSPDAFKASQTAWAAVPRQ
ncbi:MAG: phosphate transport system substrate-binding protein [Chloroflexota bacterium]|jgi:phosphate transport system substrate-binding protein|nr:phosphate transport system substrate-binding protein [Chloroflexota bacterium]